MSKESDWQLFTPIEKQQIKAICKALGGTYYGRDCAGGVIPFRSMKYDNGTSGMADNRYMSPGCIGDSDNGRLR